MRPPNISPVNLFTPGEPSTKVVNHDAIWPDSCHACFRQLRSGPAILTSFYWSAAIYDPNTGIGSRIERRKYRKEGTQRIFLLTWLVNHFVWYLCQPFCLMSLSTIWYLSPFSLDWMSCSPLCYCPVKLVATHSGENQTKKRERERKRGLQPRKMCQRPLNLAPPPPSHTRGVRFIKLSRGTTHNLHRKGLSLIHPYARSGL